MRTITSILIALVLLCACKTKNNMESLILNLKVEKKGDDYILYVRLDNKGEKDLYLNNWEPYNFLKVLSQEGKDITSQFFENEFILQTRFRHYQPSNKRSDIILDYAELFEEPKTHRKELIINAIDHETSLLLGRDKRFASMNEINEIKQILFWKYNRSIFLKSESSFNDSITITTLLNNSLDFKIIFSINPINDPDETVLRLEELNRDILVTWKPLSRIGNYFYFDKPLIDTLARKEIKIF